METGLSGSSFSELFESLTQNPWGRALSRISRTVVAVGGGGKTASLFALASFYADRGKRVLFSTTTQVRDPRKEKEQRRFDRVLVDSPLADPAFSTAPYPPETEVQIGLDTPVPGTITVLASRELFEDKKLAGIHPSWIPALKKTYDMLLVEADGSRGLPIKAPADHEPVVPSDADAVLGVVGLDCLGRPMDERTVHRPELFGPLAGCLPGQAIELSHIRSLVIHPQGLFKGSPAGALRILILNKADLGNRKGSPQFLRDLDVLRSIDSLSGVILCALKEGWASA
jgi:probable selenium-dependent hydroxylase accessory protein YqeC